MAGAGSAVSDRPGSSIVIGPSHAANNKKFTLGHYEIMSIPTEADTPFDQHAAEYDCVIVRIQRLSTLATDTLIAMYTPFQAQGLPTTHADDGGSRVYDRDVIEIYGSDQIKNFKMVCVDGENVSNMTVEWYTINRKFTTH